MEECLMLPGVGVVGVLGWRPGEAGKVDVERVSKYVQDIC